MLQRQQLRINIVATKQLQQLIVTMHLKLQRWLTTITTAKLQPKLVTTAIVTIGKPNHFAILLLPIIEEQP